MELDQGFPAPASGSKVWSTGPTQVSVEHELREVRSVAIPMSSGDLWEERVDAGATDLSAIFDPFAEARGLLLAVSGGPDSVALMLMAVEWARRAAAPPPLFVATVDHGLRQESREEAETVARWAAALALPHEILTWRGDKPRTRIQELAREARYALLIDHAVKIGADHVVTAHHADDQAETILFRLLRGSGIAGLTGMAHSSLRNGIVVARPLLAYPKARLLAYCQAKAHPFLHDPSNANPDFARTRLRRLRGLLADAGLDRQALLRLGRRAERANAALAQASQATHAKLKIDRGPAAFSADLTPFTHQTEEILLRILADELKLIRGERPVRLDRLESLVSVLIERLAKRSPFRGTLGGMIIALDSTGWLMVRQEKTRRRGQGHTSRKERR